MPVPVPLPRSLTAASDVSLKMDSTFKWTSSPDTATRLSAAGTARPVPERPLNAARSTVAAAVTTAPPNVTRLSPPLEALAQAQSLWNSGSHAAAIDLLREALTAAERANVAGTPAGNNSVLASLAREMARMELAEGQVSQTLEMLTRLEPALSGFADVWAIRGNAAQRLGRNQESAAAYLMALKLRPNEPRWMLGAAVSLAAQGQTAGGVLSAEVATYLRQLGVQLRERW
jgi:MSHA biogenesis protein MshN